MLPANPTAGIRLESNAAIATLRHIICLRSRDTIRADQRWFPDLGILPIVVRGREGIADVGMDRPRSGRHRGKPAPRGRPPTTLSWARSVRAFVPFEETRAVAVPPNRSS